MNDFREEAERIFDERFGKEIPPEPSHLTMQELVHELRVHQIELEMQNEELRKAQVELLESRNEYQHLYDFAPVGYVTLDRTGIVKQVNMTGCRLFKLDRGNFLEKPLRLYVCSEDQEIFALHLKRVFGSEQRGTSEVRFRRRDHTEFVAQLQSVLQTGVRPETRFCWTNIIDVTERKRVEKALLQSEKDLQELIYIASHDLQTPIVSMVGYANTILQKHAHHLQDKGRFAVERIKANAERLHNLVLSLLDLSRLNTVKNPYRHFSMEEVVKSIINELTLKLVESQAEIVIEPMPDIYGDEPRITSVFRNLISNALNYGGTHIVVGYAEGAYFVQDDGIGLASRHLERIFRAGERLKKIEVEGVGMGLTFCQKVISQHRGKIWAESEGEGCGTTVAFTINT